MRLGIEKGDRKARLGLLGKSGDKESSHFSEGADALALEASL